MTKISSTTRWSSGQCQLKSCNVSSETTRVVLINSTKKASYSTVNVRKSKISAVAWPVLVSLAVSFIVCNIGCYWLLELGFSAFVNLRDMGFTAYKNMLTSYWVNVPKPAQPQLNCLYVINK